MNRAAVVLAPGHEAASLIAQLAVRSSIPAPLLEEVRQLLTQYPPARIVSCLATAHAQQVQQVAGPVSQRQQQAYQQLHDGLLELASLTETVPHYMAA